MKFLLPLVLLTWVEARAQLFDPDPRHPWNALHQALNTRTTKSGATYVHDGLEPASVPRSKFLIEGESHRRIVDVLDDFLAQNADRRVTDPLKRAIMQRDLYAVFVDTASPTLPHQARRRELQKRLVQVMRRIALSGEEIEALPDNFAAAAKTKSGLPANLMKPNGAWVLVRNRMRSDDLAANLHVRATRGRAAFLILLRLPDDRKATLDYLKRLVALPKHASVPQFPVGTKVALVRRTMLIDKAGRFRATKLTESVQMRVYDDLKQPTMSEIRLHRDALFAGRSGGLIATTEAEESYFALTHLGFGRDGRWDPLEQPKVHDKRFHPPVVMNSCIICHAGPGIYGFQSMFAGHHEKLPLEATKLETQIRPVIELTQKSYAWGLLQGLWETK